MPVRDAGRRRGCASLCLGCQNLIGGSGAYAPLERSPGDDPGFSGCASRVWPLHAAQIDGLIFPGTPVGSRHQKTGKGKRSHSGAAAGGIPLPGLGPLRPRLRDTAKPDGNTVAGYHSSPRPQRKGRCGSVTDRRDGHSHGVETWWQSGKDCDA